MGRLRLSRGKKPEAADHTLTLDWPSQRVQPDDPGEVLRKLFYPGRPPRCDGSLWRKMDSKAFRSPGQPSLHLARSSVTDELLQQCYQFVPRHDSPPIGEHLRGDWRIRVGANMDTLLLTSECRFDKPVEKRALERCV